MKRIIPLFCLYTIVSLSLVAQWTANGNNIYNTNSGNVGIGSLPGFKLDIFTTASNDGLRIVNANPSATNGFVILHANSLSGGAYNNITQNGDGGIIYGTSTGSSFGFVIAPYTSPLSGLRLDQNGNLGIGTSSTGSFKLAVDGKIGARGVQVTTTSPWPDYVFTDGYKLITLDSLNNYLKTKGNLPNIPSAEDVKEKGGIELGEMNRLLLEKVEELTLYILELNKRLELLEKKSVEDIPL